ncbi:hypothetical protein ACELLULO517_14155 [Acidisoma cellulosilytica]|uniref:Uncharacterized protein n=1 Tax=Acidisoma cellulosilyticum TaxID=2802395 RepID=A0A964E4X1_9PROT|nr:hypothetical protein [Acidisoma cellulosilyticum]MCB8881388.1 hypothetical protein [Acidisoma cellulosilyticum]
MGSAMAKEFSKEFMHEPDLAHRLRRLHFFDEHFCGHMDALAARLGLSVTIDRLKLTDAFLRWGEDFNRQRNLASVNRRDFMVFTAGTLLAHLVEAQPVSVQQKSQSSLTEAPDDEVQKIIAFWPEGFLYTTYCISVLQTVIEQDEKQALPVSEIAGDLRNWWSFRENVREDRWNAIGFFDLFVGAEPNWAAPAIAAHRPAMRAKPRPVMDKQGPSALVEKDHKKEH